jgi:hypothetical protein
MMALAQSLTVIHTLGTWKPGYVLTGFNKDEIGVDLLLIISAIVSLVIGAHVMSATPYGPNQADDVLAALPRPEVNADANTGVGQQAPPPG